MSRVKTERYLDYLCDAIPAAIRAAKLRPNACILAGRLGVEALRAQGIRARPLPVSLQVCNQPMVDMLDRVGGFSKVTQADVDQANEQGAWMIALGVEPGNAGGWDGHLVLIVDERYMLDLTAGQVARLHKGIQAKPFWIPARDLVRKGGSAWRAPDGCVWVYEATDDKSYLTKPAWSGYRVSVRNGVVVSERSGPASEDVAPEVRVTLR